MLITNKHKVTIIGVLVVAIISMLGLSVTNVRKSNAVTPVGCDYNLSITNNTTYDPPRNEDGSFNLRKSPNVKIILNTLNDCLASISLVKLVLTNGSGVAGSETVTTHHDLQAPTIPSGEWYWNETWPEFNTHSSIVVRGYIQANITTDPPNQSYYPMIKETVFKLYESQTVQNTLPNTNGNTNPTPALNPTPTPPEPVELNPTVDMTVDQVEQVCIETLIGKERYAAIHSKVSEPTTDELDKIKSCFKSANYILPTVFVPVEASKTVVQKLETDTAITVKKLENVTKPDSAGKKKEVLKISGISKPNTLVLLYIFSDPIVIATKTDGNGNWQYDLEDPLKPGKHEVYAVVDRGNGTYKRSDAMPFTIGTAAATAGNPNGLSLSLVDSPVETPTQSIRGLAFYIAGSAAVLVVVLVGLYFVIRKSKKSQVQSGINATGSATLSNYGAINQNDDNPSDRLGQ